MALLACEVRPGLASFARFAILEDREGRHESLQVNADFVTFDDGQAYLPVGVVFQDRDRVLVKLVRIYRGSYEERTHRTGGMRGGLQSPQAPGLPGRRLLVRSSLCEESRRGDNPLCLRGDC